METTSYLISDLST